VANATKLDSTLANFADRIEENSARAERLLAAFSTKAPWLSTNGGILDYFHQARLDQFSHEAHAEQFKKSCTTR
jgi:hypothetical protein